MSREGAGGAIVSKERDRMGEGLGAIVSTWLSLTVIWEALEVLRRGSHHIRIAAAVVSRMTEEAKQGDQLGATAVIQVKDMA